MKKYFLFCFLLLLAAGSATAQTSAHPNNNLPKIVLTDFADGFTAPIGLENAGDSRLYVVERAGKIWILDSTGQRNPRPFLNIENLVFTTGDDERGLLGLAFHPNYPATPYFYVNFIGNDSATHITRFTVSANRDSAIFSSRQNFLIIAQPNFGNHKGGCLRFGADGYLYIATGDGGDANDPFNNAQNPQSLLGKMLRIDVDHPDGSKKYSIPPTNPFVNRNGYRKEIWATGLRNPWRFSFDKVNGHLWIADVGQGKWEEVNFQLATSKGGKNYGWSCFEGNHATYKYGNCNANRQPPQPPIAEYRHSNDTDKCASITGGFIYRGSKYPNMMARYYYVDFCTGELRTIYFKGGVWVHRYLATVAGFSYVSFGEGDNGELYLVDNSNGKIVRVTDDKTSQREEDSNLMADVADEITVYPNPNNGLFSVEIPVAEAQTFNVSLLNMLGQQVMNETREGTEGVNQWQFAMSNLAEGTYILQLRSASGIVNKKIRIQ